MVNERRLKEAFNKIKHERDRILFDINAILNKLEKQEKALELHSDVKRKIEVLNKVNLEKFVAKLDKDIDAINAFINDIDKRTEYVNKVMKNFSHQVEVQQVQFDDLKGKLKDVQKQAQDNKLDMKIIRDSEQQMAELMDEKIAMENGALRLETQTGLAEQAVALNKMSDKVDLLLQISDENDEIIPEIFEEFAIVVNQRIEQEMSELRADINYKLDEIAETLAANVKEQARVSAPAAKTTQTISTPAPKRAPSKKKVEKKKVVEKKVETKKAKPAKKATTKKVPEEKEKKDGAFRKAVRWLFVDEDEEETLSSVKKETLK